jgi:DNA-binding transcriptional ArsR family regulator
MKASYPSLMPILRSDVQGRLLAALIVNSGIEFSVTELASRVETSLPTALREIRRLEEVQFIQVRSYGNMQLCRVNREHRLFAALSEIVLYSFGPVEVLRRLFADLEGVQSAFIFGSWAERYQGVSGVDPGDIDLLLVGDFDRAKAFEIALQATSLIGKEVAVNNLSEKEWKEAESGFVRTVQSRALISIRE